MQSFYRLGNILKIIFCILGIFTAVASFSQITIKGVVKDASKNESLIGAAVLIKGTSAGVSTDFDGQFEMSVPKLPVTIVVSYIGYLSREITVSSARDRQVIALEEESKTLMEVQVKGQRISDKQKESPLTVEALDVLAIKETPAANFYNGLGNLKGVDLTTASLGFTIINTRGFNSTSPVRSLQIIDGVDNQAPGLNFSLGNFLGASELDVLKVDLIVGASSAFYGPNAFNGVISMETKNPFLQKGLSAMVKVGERNLIEGAIRWADAFKNKQGNEWLAYKFNLFGLGAYDWVADNQNPVFDTRTGRDNPGRYDKVNTYGDEYNPSGDQTTGQSNDKIGLGIFHRTGYAEKDLVDYNTRNFKGSAGIYVRTNPSKKTESPELIYNFNFGLGTTVYQGDNRFSLRNIHFIQNRIEFRKKDKYFIRAYTTNEDAGDSFDPYNTALLLQNKSKSAIQWYSDYVDFWRRTFDPRAIELGFPEPKIIINPDGTVSATFDTLRAQNWLKNYRDTLFAWHGIAEKAANKTTTLGTSDFIPVGTERFTQEFKNITTSPANRSDRPGSKFVDHSSLYHLHGEYKFEPTFLDEWIVGGNYRLYTPRSDGTIFYDSADIRITNYEFGMYTGVKKKFDNSKWTLSATVRIDKNQNFNWLASPAASVVYSPKSNTFLRLSFSSAIRNPTLTDQYLNLNVGRAILAGNIEGRKNLITLNSFRDWLYSGKLSELRYFDVAGVKPEKVKTVEAGVRTTLWDRVYVDAGYYFSLYNDFIGYNIGIQAKKTDFGLAGIQPYRLATNSLQEVTTQGFSIGLNYYFNNYYALNGNYSWNKLIKTDENDPIIPAFNTPEHKFNIGFSGRDIPSKIGSSRNTFGFSINYKWVDGFIFEGSPQFTGFIPKYDLLDVQFSYVFKKLDTTLKIGAANVLNNLHYETYGGPLIGRMAYASLLYDFAKR